MKYTTIIQKLKSFYHSNSNCGLLLHMSFGTYYRIVRIFRFACCTFFSSYFSKIPYGNFWCTLHTYTIVHEMKRPKLKLKVYKTCNLSTKSTDIPWRVQFCQGYKNEVIHIRQARNFDWFNRHDILCILTLESGLDSRI